MANESESAAQSAMIAPEQALQLALANPMLPKIYANQYSGFVGAVDLTVLLGRNNSPAAVLQFSWVFAKGFGQALIDAVAQYEQATGVTLPTLGELETMIAASSTQKP